MELCARSKGGMPVFVSGEPLLGVRLDGLDLQDGVVPDTGFTGGVLLNANTVPASLLRDVEWSSNSGLSGITGGGRPAPG
jgi:hypothetical protein